MGSTDEHEYEPTCEGQLDVDNATVGTGISDDTAEFTEAGENESEDRITIMDINITTEMNTSQLAIQQQENNGHEQGATEDILTHRYNLRK